MKNKLFLRACAVGLFSLSMLFGLGQHIAHAEQGQHAQQTHQIDYAQSHVYFSAAHAGNAFRGEFQEWQGEVHFDPADLGQSVITAEFTLSEAKTGNKMFDGTLPSADWFDVENHPKAHFETTEILDNADGTYQAEAALTLRDVTLPISFSFTVSDLAIEPVTVKAAFEIDRLAYGIGQGSDGKAEWVSQMIGIDLELIAHQQ